MWSEQSQRTKGWLSSDAIGRMFEIDEQGLVQLKVGGALYIDPAGKVRIRLGSTLNEGPGSPIELNARATVEQIRDVEAVAVAGRDLLTSVQTALLTEISDRISACTTLQTNIDTEAGARSDGDKFNTQAFTADGSLDPNVTTSTIIEIDNTRGDTTVGLGDPEDAPGQSVVVYIVAYDGGNICRVNDNVADHDFTAVDECAWFVASGTVWRRIRVP